LLDNNKGVTIFEKLYEKLYTEQEPLHFDVDIWAIANSPEFGRHDVEKVLSTMRSGFSPGLDQVTREMLKFADENTLDILATAFNHRFEGANDDSWSPVLVTLIPNTSTANKVGAYRPISLLSTSYKAYELLLVTLMPQNIQSKMDEFHFWFRKSYQALANISTARLIAEKALEKGKSLVECKTDVAKAFDTLSHNTIIDSLGFYGVEDSVIFAIIRETRGNSMMLRTPDGHMTKHIKQSRGVRQGGTISPLLFVLALSFILHDLIADLERWGMGFTDAASAICA